MGVIGVQDFSTDSLQQPTPNSHNTLVELHLEVQIPDVYNTSQEARQKINDHKTPEGVWSAQNGRALATSNHNEE